MQVDFVALLLASPAMPTRSHADPAADGERKEGVLMKALWLCRAPDTVWLSSSGPELVSTILTESRLGRQPHPALLRVTGRRRKTGPRTGFCGAGTQRPLQGGARHQPFLMAHPGPPSCAPTFPRIGREESPQAWFFKSTGIAKAPAQRSFPLVLIIVAHCIKYIKSFFFLNQHSRSYHCISHLEPNPVPVT